MADERSLASRTTKCSVGPIPQRFATTCRGSIRPFVVSQPCLFALQTRFWLVEAQPWIANQTPFKSDQENIFQY